MGQHHFLLKNTHRLRVGPRGAILWLQKRVVATSDFRGPPRGPANVLCNSAAVGQSVPPICLFDVMEEKFQLSVVAAIAQEVPESSPGGSMNTKRGAVHAVDECLRRYF